MELYKPAGGVPMGTSIFYKKSVVISVAYSIYDILYLELNDAECGAEKITVSRSVTKLLTEFQNKSSTL